MGTVLRTHNVSTKVRVERHTRHKRKPKRKSENSQNSILSCKLAHQASRHTAQADTARHRQNENLKTRLMETERLGTAKTTLGCGSSLEVPTTGYFTARCTVACWAVRVPYTNPTPSIPSLVCRRSALSRQHEPRDHPEPKAQNARCQCLRTNPIKHHGSCRSYNEFSVRCSE